VALMHDVNQSERFFAPSARTICGNLAANLRRMDTAVKKQPKNGVTMESMEKEWSGQKNWQALWQAYEETPYFNDCLCLKVGEKAPATKPADAVVLWLTGENPRSQPHDSDFNREANRRLESRLKKWMQQVANDAMGNVNTRGLPRIEKAIARHPDGKWPAEHGFFVYLPRPLWSQNREFWETLAADFGQNAIVVAEPGKPVRLMAIDPVLRHYCKTHQAANAE